MTLENTDVYTHNSSKLQLWSSNENNSMVGGQHEGLSIREALKQDKGLKAQRRKMELGKDWVFEDLTVSKIRSLGI